MTISIHADRKALALVDGESLPWIASPERGIDRRMLERVGDEVAIATSIVRYAAGTRFPSHVHAQGEEFLVLSGTFSDQYGDYPAGTYVRNPPGSAHAPHSDTGCVIFVKLRQMAADERETVRNFPASRSRVTNLIDGIEESPLYCNGGQDVALLRLYAGTSLPAREVPRGEELFIVDGAIELLDAPPARLGTWGWRRSAVSRQPALRTSEGALLWVKRGHL
jgi:quercetin dioxygenase-like cupin family protein